MTTELAKTYRPEEIEQEILARWNKSGVFHAEPSAQGPDGKPKKPFAVVIPPPNVTAALHLGHALNNTLQDILVRWRRMAGDNAMWMPGTDHAGIATQTVVEKRVLAEEGRKRTDYQREEFVAKIQAWKDEYEATISNQLKRMGCSCDWQRQRFTMDPVCAAAVREAFFQLFKDGLIYRGKRLVNWDPATQTALADDEVEMEDIDGHFYYLKYPLADGSGFVTVATTRPETMLGDTAVAISPRDPRAAQLRGKKVRLPIVNRLIPIIEDDYVVLPVAMGGDPEDTKAQFATGFLKVTPAHDDNDWLIGQRHNLPVINVLAPDATISKDHGWPAEEWSRVSGAASGAAFGGAPGSTSGENEAEFLLGMDRFEARKAIVEWFRTEKLLEDVKPYRHSVGHSYRSHVPIEPYLSDQWYVKVTDERLAGAALRAMGRQQRDGIVSTSRDREGAGVPDSTSRARKEADKCYLLTFTTYGSWLHGDVRGSVDREHALPGTLVLSGDPDREQKEFESLKHSPVTLDAPQRRQVQDAIVEVCRHRDWSLLAAHVRTNHVHVVLSADAAPEKVMSDFKSYATRHLREAGLAVEEERIWTRHGSTRYLNDDASIIAAYKYVVDQQGEVLDPPPIAVDQPLPHGRGSLMQPLADARGSSSQESPSWEGQLRFIPERYANNFRGWHENIRDWCISRQLWWGHRIPVWTIDERAYRTFNLVKQLEQWQGEGRLHVIYRYPTLSDVHHAPRPDNITGHYVCVRDENDQEIVKALENEGFAQDPDVLDTWFSSALWPISTLGWPDPRKFPQEFPEGDAALQTWNPSAVLSTAREIITLWVSRMVMFNLYFRGCLPFKDVFIHAMIQDGEGRKMSKSLGNGVDPLDIIATHGADAMRFTLAQMTTQTQDVRMPVARDEKSGKNTSPKFDIGRNFANKLWNAVRFALGNLTASDQSRALCARSGDTVAGTEKLAFSLADRWVLSRLARTIATVDEALANYNFNVYAQTLYDFAWRDLCDWYLEAIKPVVQTDTPPGSAARATLAACLDALLRLLHPVMPFLTETLWEHLGQASPQRSLPGLALPASDMCISAAWPRADATLLDEASEADFELLRLVISAIREVRTTYKIPPKQKVEASAKAPAALAGKLLAHKDLLETLAMISPSQISPTTVKPDSAAATLAGGVEIYLHGLVDAGEERKRLTKRLEEVTRSISTLQGRLSNESYLSKAPPNLVEQTRAQLSATEKERDTLQAQIAGLK
ncbi:MAG: class I tRNA ligase family protein [Phycisphaeraceae bacterium]|nr:class I tRNA ligase family protein [Phycisphaeraceae bacterium]